MLEPVLGLLVVPEPVVVELLVLGEVVLGFALGRLLELELGELVLELPVPIATLSLIWPVTLSKHLPWLLDAAGGLDGEVLGDGGLDCATARPMPAASATPDNRLSLPIMIAIPPWDGLAGVPSSGSMRARAPMFRGNRNHLASASFRPYICDSCVMRIAIECLTCGHCGSLAERELPRFGLTEDTSLVTLTKRLVCQECGSRSVRAFRYDPDAPPLAPQ